MSHFSQKVGQQGAHASPYNKISNFMIVQMCCIWKRDDFKKKIFNPEAILAQKISIFESRQSHFTVSVACTHLPDPKMVPLKSSTHISTFSQLQSGSIRIPYLPHSSFGNGGGELHVCEWGKERGGDRLQDGWERICRAKNVVGLRAESSARASAGEMVCGSLCYLPWFVHLPPVRCVWKSESANLVFRKKTSSILDIFSFF